jgi:HAD superfamily hydrolase (TIGR01549 family)
LSAGAWLIDLDGTLYHARPVQALAALELLCRGPFAIGVVRAFRQEHERMRREAIAFEPDPWRAQISRTAVRLELAPARVETLARRWLIERPGRWLRFFRRRQLLAAIHAARSRGIRTGLVSDYPASEKLARMGLASLFDTIVASGEPGGPTRLKPHPAGFLLAAERLGIAPERCLVIGDREDADGAAARAAGMGFRSVLARG